MGAQWQRFRVNINEAYTADEREAIGEMIVESIRERVQNNGTNKYGRALPGYSESYKNSLNFKIAGKSEGDVNLTLSGDMLGALTVLSHTKGSLLIGFENGTPENAKADGNIRGTYGQSKSVGPKRDFLGIPKDDLRAILAEFPLKDDEKRQTNAAVSKAANKTTNKAKDGEVDDGEDQG